MKRNLFDLCNDQIKNMQNYIMFRIKARQIELTPELKAKDRAPIALSMGAPTDKVSDYVINKTIEYLNDDTLHSYSTPKGEAKFLNAVKYRMQKRFGVELNPKDEIFSLIGSKEGISNFIRAIVNPQKEDKDVIWLPTPGYASYTQMAKVSGARAYSIELTKENNYMPNLYDVYQKYINEGNDPNKIKAVVINYPNNPLGCTCTLEYLQHCVDFCLDKGLILISDNAYCDLYFDEDYRPHSALECKGAMDCCIEFYSFSKSYAMTGWRLGWACGNKDLILMLSREKSTLDTGIFKVLQYAGADLLESEEGQKYIEELNLKFKNKLKRFTDGLKSLGYNIEMPKATFYLWLEIPKRYKDCEEFQKELLEKSGVVVVPGTAFDSSATRFIRLSVVDNDTKLDEVIRRMKEDGFCC